MRGDELFRSMARDESIEPIKFIETANPLQQDFTFIDMRYRVGSATLLSAESGGMDWFNNQRLLLLE